MITRSLVNKGNVKLNIGIFYALQVLSNSFSFSIPVLVPILIKYGMSPGETLYLQAAYIFVVALLQTPTGYFADLYGRKLSIIVGCATACFGIFIYLIADSATTFVVAELVLALATAFYSGANTALLYESMEACGRIHEYGKVYGRCIAISHATGLVMLVIGGYLASFGERVPFLATLICEIAFLLLSFLLIETKGRIALGPKQKKAFLDAFNYALFKNKALSFLIFFQAIVLSATLVTFWYLPLIFNYFEVKEIYFGKLYALLGLIVTVASAYAFSIERKLGRAMHSMLITFLSIGFLLIGYNTVIIACIGLFLIQVTQGISQVYFDKHITVHSPENRRATVKSIGSFVLNIGQCLLLIICGVLLDNFEIPKVMLITGLIVLMFSILLLYVDKKAN